MTGSGSDRARFGPFEVDLHTHEFWKFGTRLKLVGQPFAILAVLLSKPGELVTREELHRLLWPSDTFVDFNHGLNAAVNKLREALSDSAESPRYVETLPRRGYRFIAAIEWLDTKPVVLTTPSPVAAVPTGPAYPGQSFPLAGTSSPATRRRKWPGYLMGFAAALALIFAVSMFSKNVLRRWAESALPTSASRKSGLLTSVRGAVEPAFSPDGNSVAFVRANAEPGEEGIFVTRVGSDQAIQLTHDSGDRNPVWSPDGRWIAFSRFSNKEYSIYVVAADGGEERKRNAEKTLGTQAASFTQTTPDGNERRLDTNGVQPSHGELDWSPDGKSIAFAGGSGIYLLFSESSAVQRLTEQPLMSEDWGPAFSPDGGKVLFVRDREIGRPDEIWVTSANGGAINRVLSEPGKIASPPRWSSDGRSIIYASNRSGHPALWRVSLNAPDSPVQIPEAGSPAWDPAVSRRGYRLAYERLIRNLSIWQMDLSAAPDQPPHLLVSSTSDTDQGPAPQFSPDGEKLAYMSDRSGTMEIWMSHRDGSNPFQLTAVGGAGTPRWSPDSQAVVFDAYSEGHSRIATINLRDGAPQVLTPGPYESVCPSWSHDGKWIYFASERLGDRQVWKVPATGGTPVQVTRHGGHAALESPDGKTVYYAKTFVAEPEIWQVPVEGGAETPLPLVRPGTWASWQVVKGGIVFVGPSLGHQAVLSFFDFASHKTTTIAVLKRTPFWLGATPDGRTVAFDQPGQEQAQAMLVENFR